MGRGERRAQPGTTCTHPPTPVPTRDAGNCATSHKPPALAHGEPHNGDRAPPPDDHPTPTPSEPPPPPAQPPEAYAVPRGRTSRAHPGCEGRAVHGVRVSGVDGDGLRDR